MPEAVVLLIAAAGTALATGLGAVPVFMLGRQRAARLAPFLLGLAPGVMAGGASAGLLSPAPEKGARLAVVAGFAVGVIFLVAVWKLMRPDAGFLGRTGPGSRTSALVFLVLFVHSLPEGLAIGTAFASDRAGLSLFVILAIAIQNIPEGTSVAIPMEQAGFSRGRQFWAAVMTSAPQPIGALIAYLAVEEISGLLPFSFAFAAGAMLALIVVELLPKAYAPPAQRSEPSVGIAVGAGLRLVLSLIVGV